MNRREFTKAIGLAPVAMLTAKAVAKPEMVEVVEVFQKGIPAGTMCYIDDDGNIVPFIMTNFTDFPENHIPVVKPSNATAKEVGSFFEFKITRARKSCLNPNA